jgi:ubiquinone/menaquinone biosynthesis C-methylase UbiE
MSESQPSANLGTYRAEEVVAYYARSSDLGGCERSLFDTYLKPGMAILDLGVGGGRTTPYLSEVASYYVGLDYSEEMIEVCRTKFPHLQFVVADASDLSRFLDGSFDAVVFSFNGLGHLAPDEKRLQCLRECRRVLKPGGIFIFSVHNPRALFIDWRWDRERLRRLAKRFSGRATLLFYPALAILTCARVGLALLRTLTKAIPRAYRRLPTKTFWHGEGYLLIPTHGGLLMHFALPHRVIAELANLNFEFLRELPEGYPDKGRRFGTRWFYYAFAKTTAPESPTA